MTAPARKRPWPYTPKQPRKRFCRNGHDTQEHGRDPNGYCWECRRLRDRCSGQNIKDQTHLHIEAKVKERMQRIGRTWHRLPYSDRERIVKQVVETLPLKTATRWRKLYSVAEVRA